MTTAANRALDGRRDEDHRFQRALGISTGVHGLALALIIVMQEVAPPPEPLIKPDDAIQVDLVMGPAAGASPRHTNRLPDKATHAPAAEPESKEPSVPLEPPKPRKEEVKQEKPKEEKAKEPAKVEPPREAKSIADAMKKEPTPKPSDPGLDESARESMARRIAMLNLRDRARNLEGAEGRRDRSASASDGSGHGNGNGHGSSTVGSDSGWGSALNERISNDWLVLPTLLHRQLQVEVFVRVDTEGGVLEASVEKSSGDANFDNYAVRAIKKSAPLPLPGKADVRRAVLAEGFTLVFNPKGMTK